MRFAKIVKSQVAYTVSQKRKVTIISDICMELEEFITTTLLSIKKGINVANIKIAEDNGKELGVDETIQYEIDSESKGIKFDIAVTVSSETTGNGGGGIKVAVVNIGASVTSASAQEHISRISFEVDAFKSVH